MKNLKVLAMTAISATMLLTGCCVSHDWQEASCEAPETCSKCGETRGEVLEHVWQEATCTEPETCELCGETNGEALGHSFVEATCTESKTCEVCGETEGEALGHSWLSATMDAPKTCEICGETEGEPVQFITLETDFLADYWSTYFVNENTIVAEKYNDGLCNFDIYDADGNITKSFEKNLREDNGWWSGSMFDGFENGFYFSYLDSGKNPTKTIIEIYTEEGDIEDSVEIAYEDSMWNFNGNWPKKRVSGDYIIFTDYNDTSIIGIVYDRANHQWIAADDFTDEEIVYDKEKWSFFGDYNANVDRYLVSDAETGEWGYADSEGNVINMYKDASGYNDLGYALVTVDGENYSIIDKDGNVIGENVIKGTGASCGSNVFNVRNGNEATFCVVK